MDNIMNIIQSDAFIGFLSGVLINLLPFVNRNLDKLTSSYAAKVIFFLVETVEAFEDGKLTKEEVNRAFREAESLIDHMAVNKP